MKTKLLNDPTPGGLLKSVVKRGALVIPAGDDNDKLYRAIRLAQAGPGFLIEVKYLGITERLKELRLRFFIAASDYFLENKIYNPAAPTRAGFITDMAALVLAEHINPAPLLCSICRGVGFKGNIQCGGCNGHGSHSIANRTRAAYLQITPDIFVTLWQPIYQELQLIAATWERGVMNYK